MQNCFPKWLSNFIFSWWLILYSTFSSKLSVISLFNFIHSNVCVALISVCIFLMTKLSIFSCAYDHYFIFFCEVSMSSFFIIFIKLFLFLLLTCKSHLWILVMSLLADTHTASIFPNIWHVFCFLNLPFEQKNKI